MGGIDFMENGDKNNIGSHFENVFSRISNELDITNDGTVDELGITNNFISYELDITNNSTFWWGKYDRS